MLTSKAPLNYYEGFRSSNLDDLFRVVESRLNAKLLKAPSAAFVDAFANSCELPTSQLWFCSYGAPLTLRFADGDYTRVQVSHRGTGRTSVGNSAVSITTRQCCVSRADAAIEFGAGFQQLAWRVGRNVLTTKLGALVGVPMTRPIEFDGALAMDAGSTRRFSSILNCILIHLAQSNPSTRPLVLEELEQALIVSLLSNCEHNLQHRLVGPPHSPTPRQVRNVEEYIAANFAKPFRIEEMAAITGVSTRSLYRAFRESRGYSPMEFLKQRRLVQARHMLENPDSVMSVTLVAFACGFSDVSRFSKDFARAYGESPSAVRNRAKLR